MDGFVWLSSRDDPLERMNSLAARELLTSQDVVLVNLIGLRGHLHEAIESVRLNEAGGELGIVLLLFGTTRPKSQDGVGER